MDVTETHVCFCVTDVDVDVHDILRYQLKQMNIHSNSKCKNQVVFDKHIGKFVFQIQLQIRFDGRSSTEAWKEIDLNSSSIVSKAAPEEIGNNE